RVRSGMCVGRREQAYDAAHCLHPRSERREVDRTAELRRVQWVARERRDVLDRDGDTESERRACGPAGGLAAAAVGFAEREGTAHRLTEYETGAFVVRIGKHQRGTGRSSSAR